MEGSGRNELGPQVQDQSLFTGQGRPSPRTEREYFRLSTLVEDCLGKLCVEANSDVETEHRKHFKDGDKHTTLRKELAGPLFHPVPESLK